MQHRVLAFAAAAEIFGGSSCAVALPAGATVADLRQRLLEDHPALGELVTFAIARNELYALPEEVLEPGDELVVIPPVSGG
ncbi:MoaD/ThiS family protein [Lewinella lacunae]|uniref:Molybdopterin synthase sulfur carrier subunit n=1 Tax=Neolewinella lacunae TaxID=1517758 RepID=A0A923T6R2_9BACT|nr:MoaD/ThiS family protein [Neolewinella lacunae]